MFFLVLEEPAFPITFPVSLVSGVNMNEALRQPMEFTQPKVIKYSLPFVFMQLAPPIFPANATAVGAPTQVTLFTEGATNIEFAAI
jgi:hypothetical protein|tara:strand:+ start:386 stop:643 length:258 start_codon:yes stop_codon:yes gene_type:complete